MAISEDTAALVAAQLTNAFFVTKSVEPRIDEGHVLKVYNTFLAEVGKRPTGGVKVQKLGGV